MNSLWAELSFKDIAARIAVWQEREFLYILLAMFVLGLLPIMWWGFDEAWLLPLAVVVAVTTFLAVVLRRPSIFYIPLFVLGLMWGGLNLLQTESFPVAADEAVAFSGKVVEVLDGEDNYFAQLAEFSSDATTFVIRGRTDDGWHGKLMIIGSEAEVRPGDRLSLVAIVRGFTETDNFGLLDNDYLLNNGIGAVAMAVQSTVSFEKFASPYSPINLGSAIRDNVFDAMRQLPSRQQALLKGIGFGETGMLTNGAKAVLQQTGIMHIFAVSGMHIAYVTMLAGAVLEFLRRRLRLDYRFVVIGTMIIVMAFCLVVGFSPSVVRSAIMSMAALLGLLLLRQHSAGHALIFAAFVMLLYQPRWLVQPGFIMSFLATGGIIYTTAYWQKLVPNNTLAATFAAQFAVMPVVSYFYNTVSLIGFVISPIIALGSGVVVILLLLAMAFAPFGLGLIPLAGAGLLAEGLYKSAEIFASLPGSFTYTPRLSVAALIGYYLLLAAAYLILARCENVKANEEANNDGLSQDETGV